MKIISGLDLINQPTGTLFQEYEPHALIGPLSLLIEGLHKGDFISRELGADAVHRYDFSHYSTEATQISSERMDGFVLPSVASRDGLYDLENRQFLVYDEEDRAALVDLLMGREDTTGSVLILGTEE